MIIKELDLIIIAVKNDKICSLSGGKADKMDEILARFENIRNLLKAKNLQKPDI